MIFYNFLGLHFLLYYHPTIVGTFDERVLSRKLLQRMEHTHTVKTQVYTASEKYPLDREGQSNASRLQSTVYLIFKSGFLSKMFILTTR